jgi:hypothetical protein
MTNQATLSPNQVTSTVEGEQKGTLPVQAIQFMPVTDLTTFAAEVAVTEGDLVYHFFVTQEVNALPDARKYWLELFPEVLEKTAQEYFKADFPRLKAAYTEEQASWWLRAFGFGHVLDPHKLALSFCDALDAALDAATQNSK